MFQNVYKGKKVLITGNTGFKGGWISTWLKTLGADVYGYSKDIPTTPSFFEETALEQEMKHFEKDVRSIEDVKEIVQSVKPDFVFHMAAQPIVSESYKNPLETFSSNVMGTANILEALRINNHSCVAIMITSDKCYDNVEWVWGYREHDALGGKDIYSGSKGAAELVIKSYFHSFFKDSNVRVASVRAGNVIGGGDWAQDRIVPDCFRAWSFGEAVTIRSPYATRPWQHVLEPISGYLAIGEALFNDSKLSGESYNFGPSAEGNFTVLRLLTDLSKIWGFESSNDAFKIFEASEFHEAKLLKLNCDKALFDLKWTPTMDYENTIKFVGEWYVNFYKSKKLSSKELTISQIKDYEKMAIEKGVQWAKN